MHTILDSGTLQFRALTVESDALNHPIESNKIVSILFESIDLKLVPLLALFEGQASHSYKAMSTARSG